MLLDNDNMKNHVDDENSENQYFKKNIIDDDDDDVDNGFFSEEIIIPKNENTNIISNYIKHQPLKYGKKLYIGEFLAERFIQLVAFLSIAAIIAIFFYVFQESSWAFKTPRKVTSQNIQNSKSNNSSEKSESYSSDNKSNNKELQSESYSSSSNKSGELKSETYGSTDNKSEELKSETYGSTDNKSEELKSETYGSTDNKSEELKSETYGSTDNKSGELKSETYGSTDNKSNENIESKPENSNQNAMETVEKGVTLQDLVSPNAVVDEKQDYVWQPVSQIAKYSLVPLVIGAFKVTMIGITIAAPIGILAAIFTVAFSPRWLRELIKPSIEILAGFPSVVIGFFCLITLATVIQELFHTTFRLNSFVGGIGMSLVVIPIIYTVAEDALSAVPKNLKEASLALGASRWQTAYKVMLPAATPGVFAAIILGFGRAFGETMIALMATGNAALNNWNLFDSVRTMSATIGAEMAEVEFRGVHYGVLFLIGAILFVVTFSLNAIAEFYVRKRILKRFQGK